jgi:hypothetical protein
MAVDVPWQWHGRGIEIDLGEVHSAAEVRWDGTVVGKPWCHPFRVSLPDRLVKAGPHRLEVVVAAHLLVSVQAMEQPPTPPAYLGKSLPPRNAEWNSWLRDKNFKPLPTSGLSGPVTIRTWKK